MSYSYKSKMHILFAKIKITEKSTAHGEVKLKTMVDDFFFSIIYE